MVTVEHGIHLCNGQGSNIGTSQGISNMREELFSSSASQEELSHIVVRKSQKSEVVEDNGFNPSWTLHSVFVFSNSDLTFLRYLCYSIYRAKVFI